MESKRYLTNGYTISNNTWETRLNNNDLICGATGCGKTRGYVIPNIKMAQESMIICDTKGILYGEYAADLRKRGYKVFNIDFIADTSQCGYNPLKYVRKNALTGQYREDDIQKIAEVMCPLENKDDIFWDQAAKMFLASLIAFTLEAYPEEYHTFETVRKLSVLLGKTHPGAAEKGDLQQRQDVRDAFVSKFRFFTDTVDENGNDVYLMSTAEMANAISNTSIVPYTCTTMMSEHEKRNPDSVAVKIYKTFKCIAEAEKMYASILGVVAEKLNTLVSNEQIALYKNKRQIMFDTFGKRKIALFLTVSDTDRTKDKLVNMLYTQALDTLVRSADNDFKDHRLKVPVRFILDDFAAGSIIPDFDNIIAVIRSREISVSIIIQSISQLYDKYGEYKAATILNNCDHMIYLGGQDIATAEYVSKRTNKTLSSIIEQPLTATYLIERGSKAIYLPGIETITMKKGGMEYDK